MDMDPAAIVESLMYRFQRSNIGLEHQTILSLADCEAQYAEATNKTPTHALNGHFLQPDGGILHYQHVPLLFLHCVRPNQNQNQNEAMDAAECAMFLRATEMFFAAQPVYPVVFVVEGGTPEFWTFMRVFQMGQEGNLNPYKVAGHSVPIVIPYTTLSDVVNLVTEVVKDALEAAAIPDAER